MARPSGTGRLAEWEVAEMAHYAKCGWTLYELASHYGLSERSVQRILRRMPRDAAVAPQGVARRENE